MSDAADTLLDQAAIQHLLHRYARACDERQWSAFDSIFCEDISVNYGGEFKLDGRIAAVDMIKSMLGGCGPTQHLLGNYDIIIEHDKAYSRCYVRAGHAGLGDDENLFYEVWAEYHDTLVRRTQGWWITQRSMLVHKEIGTRAVLKPAP